MYSILNFIKSNELLSLIVLLLINCRETLESYFNDIEVRLAQGRSYSYKEVQIREHPTLNIT